MPWPKTWVGLRGLLQKSAATSLSLLICQSFVYSASEPVRLTHEVSVPEVQKTLEQNSTWQGSHYVTNTYLRSDLREKQTGATLFLQITVLDSRSCAPVENALIEIWGANQDGKYSAEHDATKPGCSSWLRGGFPTDAEGIAKFETIYPGAESKRAPHLNAIIRSDWYEYANNQTIASNSTHFVAAAGSIFFPDDVNGHVYKNFNYTDAKTKVVKNEADPSFKARNLSWRAEAQPFMDGPNGVIRAHLTISIELDMPQKLQVESVGPQCSTKCANSANQTATTPQPTTIDQNSSASLCQPSMVFILMVNMMVIYNMYGRNNNNDSRKQQIDCRFIASKDVT